MTPIVDATSPPAVTCRHEFAEPLRFGQQVAVSFSWSGLDMPPNTLSLSYTFWVTPGNGTNGDIDGSGRADGVDLSLLTEAFGAAP